MILPGISLGGTTVIPIFQKKNSLGGERQEPSPLIPINIKTFWYKKKILSKRKKRSPQPRDETQVSRFAGGLLTSLATSLKPMDVVWARGRDGGL